MRLLHYAGYGALFVVSLVLGLYGSFPWNTLKDRILTQVSAQSGWRITADSLRPSWLTGATLEGLSAQPPKDVPPLELDEVSVRAHVFTLLSGGQGATIHAPLGRGTLDAQVSTDETSQSLKLDLNNVEMGLVRGLQSVTDLPLTGEVNAKVDLTVSAKNPADSTGSIQLSGKQIELGEGGRFGVYPIPSMLVGNLDWTIQVQSGKAQLANQQIRGGDVELDLDGVVNLAMPLPRSTVDLTISFRPTPAFLADQPLLRSLLNNIRQAKGSDGFYSYRVIGSLGSPRAVAQRR